MNVAIMSDKELYFESDQHTNYWAQNYIVELCFSAA